MRSPMLNIHYSEVTKYDTVAQKDRCPFLGLKTPSQLHNLMKNAD